MSRKKKFKLIENHMQDTICHLVAAFLTERHLSLVTTKVCDNTNNVSATGIKQNPTFLSKSVVNNVDFFLQNIRHSLLKWFFS